MPELLELSVIIVNWNSAEFVRRNRQMDSRIIIAEKLLTACLELPPPK